VTSASAIELHVAADTPEELGLWLAEHAIPYEQGERRLRFGGERHAVLPLFRFTADDATIELLLFDRLSARETPLSPVDGRPMRRAGLREVEALVRASEARV
jgi:hypothetical protein